MRSDFARRFLGSKFAQWPWGDTAIDWSRIHKHKDWARLGFNNVSFAAAIVEQVPAKKRRA